MRARPKDKTKRRQASNDRPVVPPERGDGRRGTQARAESRTSSQQASGHAQATLAHATQGDSGARRDSRTSTTRASARSTTVRWLTVVGAGHNNLKDITVRIPLGRFVCITGVSGSGKSSLVNDILFPALAVRLNEVDGVTPGRHQRIDGLEHLDRVIDIDQTPIGRTPRSNPATYIKVFDLIRNLYAELPDARVRGYKPGRFSFNVDTGERGGGRCEACDGYGATRMEMDFLADVWVTCPVCKGRRFNRETLEVRFKGKSISDVLEMDIDAALAHFEAVPKIAAMLRTLHEVGLGYMKLGQSSTTLSGGEAQRIKLARELVKRSTGRTMYLLDEPTTGLHFHDIKRLLKVLHSFVDAGNTVVVIEHNLDVVKTADWIIDLGPEGGEEGGLVVAEGTPEQVAADPRSYTGQALQGVLRNVEGGVWEAEGGRLKVEGGRRKVEGGGRKAEGGMRNEEPGARRTGRGTLCETPRDASAIADLRSQISESIQVRGARQNNLQGIDVDIPRGRMTVCSGPSGSGKSSFAIDTVYTEGQRRYVESLSAYARQFLGQLQPPKVDHVYGLSPAICIEQKPGHSTPRSTVGTVTEIYDYMRVLWARIGEPYCPACGTPIGSQTSDEIVERVIGLGEGQRLLLLAPIERSGQESWAKTLARHRESGYARVWVDGAVHPLAEPVPLDEKRDHKVALVVDRIVVHADRHGRIADSVEQALSVGGGVMMVQEDAAPPAPSDDAASKLPNPSFQLPIGDADPQSTSAHRQPAIGNRQSRLVRFSQHRSCNSCGRSFEELSPHHFSFNNRLGWCEACEGLGVQQGASLGAIVVHPTKSILDGAIVGWDRVRPGSLLDRMLRALADRIGFDASHPWNSLPESCRNAMLYGLGDEWISLQGTGSREQGAGNREPGAGRGVRNRGRSGVRFRWRGLVPAVGRATRTSWQYRQRLESVLSEVPCEACGGSRIRPDAAAVRVRGASLREVCSMSLGEALVWFERIKLTGHLKKLAGELLHEITTRLRFLVEVGLDYVTLHRTNNTLSGGEAQRIRLASQLGTGLTGVLYVLDEPTIGLHPRDTGRLLRAMQRLRDLGNTLLVVEHDREVIGGADHLLDFGPGAGRHGGRITAQGTPEAVRAAGESLTGKYLSLRESIPVPTNRRPPGENWLTVHGARENNLRSIDAAFPVGLFTCVTGVSGSGKSTLVSDILYNKLASRLHRARLAAGAHDKITGLKEIDKVINVDQSPIGSTPTSNPATYTGLFDEIRKLFARTQLARQRGYKPGRFSFLRAGGRCEACEGMGQRRIEMHFLPDVWVTCEHCKGARYVAETLEVTYHGKNISDVLNMTVSEALELFRAVPKICRLLTTLDDVGLGYVQLGQSAATFSGGEAQRVKLAAELGRPSTGRTVYILDEPTTGLHFDDLRKLLAVLHRLVDLGNTVICIEHNLDVIKTADWIIDLGPEGGDAGGTIVASGTPEQVAAAAGSHTGAALRPVLAAGPRAERKQQKLPPRLPTAKEKAAQDIQRLLRALDSHGHDLDPAALEGARPVLKNV